MGLEPVLAEVVNSARILNMAIFADSSSESGPVFDNIDLRNMILTMQTNKHGIDAARMDLPTHLCVFRSLRSHRPKIAQRPGRAMSDKRAGIVIRSQKIQGARNNFQVTRLCPGSKFAQLRENVGGILSAEKRVKEPAMKLAIQESSSSLVLW